MTRVARLPLRVKLTLVFVTVMGLVLSGTGAFLYLRTKSNLDSAIRDSLRARGGGLVQAVRTNAGRDPRHLIESGERYAQVLTLDGQIVGAHPQSTAPLLVPGEAAQAASHRRFIERHERTRLLAIPVRVGGRTLVAVVASSLADRESALESLGATLAIGGPLALLLAAALAYALAAAALRPVESMRRRAANITAADLGARLPLPPAEDEIHRLATTLNEMLSRLAESAAQQQAFVANASHELRTPLTRIRAELELAVDYAQTLDEFRFAASAAIVDTDELAQLADDLLVLAGSNSTATPLRLEKVEVDKLVAEIAGEIRAEAGEASRGVHIEVRDGLQMCADRGRLARALRNMARNSVIHGSGEITIGAAANGVTNSVWVRDQGVPLPEHELTRLFDRFERGAAKHERAGSGLGLAILREIADAHGGEARLTNEPGGVRCTLEFPQGLS